MTQGTIVSTSAGRLSGQEAPNGTVMFRGIPYAAPPIGSLRWMPPEAPANWDGVRPAHAFGAPCPQRVLPGFEINQFSNAPPPNEDCLYLNVYTPGCDVDAPYEAERLAFSKVSDEALSDPGFGLEE